MVHNVCLLRFYTKIAGPRIRLYACSAPATYTRVRCNEFISWMKISNNLDHGEDDRGILPVGAGGGVARRRRLQRRHRAACRAIHGHRRRRGRAAAVDGFELVLAAGDRGSGEHGGWRVMVLLVMMVMLVLLVVPCRGVRRRVLHGRIVLLLLLVMVLPVMVVVLRLVLLRWRSVKQGHDVFVRQPRPVGGACAAGAAAANSARRTSAAHAAGPTRQAAPHRREGQRRSGGGRRCSRCSQGRRCCHRSEWVHPCAACLLLLGWSSRSGGNASGPPPMQRKRIKVVGAGSRSLGGLLRRLQQGRGCRAAAA